MRVAGEQRTVLLTAALCFIASAAATILWCGSMSSMPGMEMAGGWTMSMAWMRMPGQGWLGAAATFLGMWTLMMIAMMLPVLVPALLCHRPAKSTLIVAGGYFAAWLSFGVALYAAGAGLAELAMRNAGVARLVPVAMGVVLVVAGALQSTRWKSRALERCRRRDDCCSAAADGFTSSWRHGASLGARCVRCCAPWTAVLLVLGVMDLEAMALVTVAISLERLLPRGERVARVAGIAILATGVLVLTHT